MYKRRKKAIHPQASSTMLSSGPVLSTCPGSSSALSQASTNSNESRKSSVSPLRGKRSESPSVCGFSLLTTDGSGTAPLPKNVLNPVDEPSNVQSPVRAKRQLAAQQVLEMLTSPKSTSSSNGPSPSKRRRVELPTQTGNNYMEELLYKCGFELVEGSDSNILRKDQTVFIREISRMLKSGNTEQNVNEFLKHLSNRLEDKTAFKTALSQTRIDSDLEDVPTEMRESLLRLLLAVDLVQPALIDLLLDKLAEYIISETDSTVVDERIMWVRLILRTMRYLNKIVDSSKITKSLFDVIHSAPDIMIQTEIIMSIPDITGDDQCEEVALELIDLMKNEPRLAPSIITSLSNIGLQGETLYQVQMSLIKNLRSCQVDQIPSFIKFIVGHVENGHIDELINGLRSELVLCQTGETTLSQISTATNKTDVSSVLVLAFEGIRDAVLMSKKLANAWLKNISKLKPGKAQKPIDIVMLLVIYASSDQTKKKAVEAVFKSKIRDGTFKEGLIDDTVNVVAEILKLYFSELLKLLSLLLNSPNISVSKVASYFLRVCFTKMDSLYCRMIILELLESVRLDCKNTKNVLDLLQVLTDQAPSKVAQYVTLIMLLLDSLADMKIVEVRKLMDIIGHVAWGEGSTDMRDLQDEIVMIVQKQLLCPDSKVFRNGVVCALMVIKHLTCMTENEANDTPLSDIEQDSIVLNNRAEKAFNFLELIIQGCNSNLDLHILTSYDQLAYVVMNSDNMDKAFMKKVSQIMQATLQNAYIIATSDFSTKDEGLDEKLQFSLDSDLEDPIILNLCEAVINETKSKHSSSENRAIALPALLRVIRSLELADLTEIDALLGCAISLPSANIYSKFSVQDPFEQKVALDCLFHACNWFREIINSFVYMIKEGTPDKIVSRLRLIVYLQNLLARSIPQALNYTLPSCNVDPSNPFHSMEKTKKINHTRKKTKKKSDKVDRDEDETVAEESVVADSDEDEESIVAIEISRFREHLREFDFDVCLVLTLPLTLNPEPPKNGSFSPQLGPSELLLMLEDLSSKLTFCMNSKRTFGFKKTSQIGFDNLMSTPLDIVVKNTSKLIGHITGHLHKLVEYLHNLINVHDGCYDAPGMFIQGSWEIKQCTAMTFQIFDTFFSWPDLKSDLYMKFLLRALMKVAGKPVEKNQSLSLNYAVQQAIEYLKTIATCILDITSAVNLTSLITTLSTIQEEEEEDYTELNSVDECEKFLKMKWYDMKGCEEKGPQMNQQLGKLLELYFEQGSLATLSSNLAILSEETKNLGSDSFLQSFPHFQKLVTLWHDSIEEASLVDVEWSDIERLYAMTSNLHVFVRSSCKALAVVVKKGIEGKDHAAQLKLWDSTVSCLQDLVITLKNEDSIVNLRQFLKGCLPIMKLFQSNGMPVCSLLFKFDSLTVSQTIKKLQVVTRYVHNICNYSKVIKDRTLIQQLPSIRGVLEQILLSVKSIVLQNKCTDAFFMGSMKNKDHHGDVIPTQDSLNETETNDSEEIGGAPEISPIHSEDENDDNSESVSDAC